MAKRLGLDPKSLIKNIPDKNQGWKEPVCLWVRDMYYDRFGESKDHLVRIKMYIRDEEY